MWIGVNCEVITCRQTELPNWSRALRFLLGRGKKTLVKHFCLPAFHKVSLKANAEVLSKINRFLWLKGTQDPGQRLSTPVQFFKLWSHWSKNDGSNLGSHWWKYCLRICAKPNIWNNNNVRNWTFIVLQGVIRAVDQGKGSHQQAQPLPEVRVFYLAYLQKHLFALWMGSGEAQIWRWSEWDLGTWGLGSHESGEDEA